MDDDMSGNISDKELDEMYEKKVFTTQAANNFNQTVRKMSKIRES